MAVTQAQARRAEQNKGPDSGRCDINGFWSLEQLTKGALNRLLSSIEGIALPYTLRLVNRAAICVCRQCKFNGRQLIHQWRFQIRLYCHA